MKKLTFMAAMLMVLGIFATAQATVIDVVGDKDCFGLNGSCSDGSLWATDLGGTFWQSYQEGSDPYFTDRWFDGAAISYNHTYSLDGTAASAVLRILIAGIADNEPDGIRGPWNVYFNDQQLGQFIFDSTLGDDSNQAVRLFAFNVPIALLTGPGAVLLDINKNLTDPNEGDGYSIDYSELTINTVPVPEPATMLLLCLGLIGLAGIRRKLN